MKKPEPKCPYCGEEMKIMTQEFYEGAYCSGYTFCPQCGSYGPSLAGDVSKEQLRDELKASALRRPLKKPLTLDELHVLIETSDEVVTFCESKESDRTYANIWIGDSVIDFASIEQKINVHFRSYGKTWRAWAARPTDEERAAAPWEE